MTTVVVTRMSQGPGRAMAVKFAAEGYTVCGCARSAEAVEKFTRQLGTPHRFDVVDIAEDSSLK